MKKLLLIMTMIILTSCATSQQRQEATEGLIIETGKSRGIVIEAIVNMLTQEGYSIDTINEKYGIVNCKPYKILTGELMKKIDEPGASLFAANEDMLHTIEFSSSVTRGGVIRLKAVATQENSEDVVTLSMDIQRTIKLHQYYAKKIKSILNLE